MFVCLYTLLASLVFIYTLSFIWRVVLPSLSVSRPELLKARYNSSGKAWVIVTGTTSGIGFAFCALVLKLGFNLLMVSRNEGKLKETKNLLKNFGKKIEYITLDLSQSEVDFGEVEKFVSSNEVCMLINNAGLNTEYPKPFIGNSKEEISSMVTVNCHSMVLLTRICLASMVHRRCGAIINISSLFGELNGPLVSTYSGTKSFIDSFSVSLAGELAGSGVKIFCSQPGFVISNMSKLRKPSLTVISAEQCVDTILGQVANGKYTIAAPHWTHAAISWAMMWLLPAGFRLRILHYINEKTHQAALRKIQRQKE